jgi:hypothetical protein
MLDVNRAEWVINEVLYGEIRFELGAFYFPRAKRG